MRVRMVPDLRSSGPEGGIKRVLEAYHRHLPAYGIEYVADGEPYDIKCSHAGAAAPVDVAHCHGFYWTADMPSVGWEWKANKEVVEAVRSAYLVTVPSRWVAESVARDFRVWPEVIGHGIELADFEPGENLGYVLWNKNRQSDACTPRPMQRLAQMVPGERFLTTFGAPTDNVRVTGAMPHEQMRQVIAGAGVYLSTTKETFGIGVLEALASGVPVLGFAWGGNNDLVRHLETGYLARVDDYGDLRDGLAYCQANRERLSEAAREAAKAWTWPEIARQVADVYERALGMKSEPATVAIIIPCYNYGNVVGRAIDSALAQERRPDEIIVVDDGSTDNTQDVLRTYAAAHPDLVRIITKANGGVATARNAGAAAAKSNHLCFLDADDGLEPGFLRVCMDALAAEPRLSIAYTGLLIVNQAGMSGPGTWPGDWQYDQQVRGKNQIPTCCVMRRKVWQRLGGYRQRYAPHGAGSEDAEFWLRAGAYGMVAEKVSEQPLFVYSVGAGITTRRDAPKEVDWLAWHPWVRDASHPLASLATPAGQRLTHAARQYDRPAVSIIIPVGPGHEHVLVDALDSLDAQTLRTWEAIVVNDTGGILDLDAFPYVRLVTTSGSEGAGAARNAGIAIARAPLFLCLDADDYLQPEALQKMLDAWVDLEWESGWLYSDCFIQGADGAIETYRSADFDVERLQHSGLAGVTALYTVADWRKVGGFDTISPREDWDYHFRLAAAGICGQRLPQALWTYRHATGQRRESNTSHGEAVRLRQQYPIEGMRQMCGGCSKRKIAPPDASLSRAAGATHQVGATRQVNGTVMVEYVGGNRGDASFRGTTGKMFRFGANDGNRIQAVPVEDLPDLLNKKVLRLFRAPVPSEPEGLALVAAPAPKAA